MHFRNATAYVSFDHCRAVSSNHPIIEMVNFSSLFIVSAIIGFLFISYSTEIPILFASPEYGSQYVFIFFIVCVLLLSIFLLYNSRFYFIWANNLWYKFILKRNFRRFSAADSYCRQYVEFRSDNSILHNHLYRPFNDQPLNVLSKEKLLCLFIASRT